MKKFKHTARNTCESLKRKFSINNLDSLIRSLLGISRAFNKRLLAQNDFIYFSYVLPTMKLIQSKEICWNLQFSFLLLTKRHENVEWLDTKYVYRKLKRKKANKLRHWIVIFLDEMNNLKLTNLNSIHCSSFFLYEEQKHNSNDKQVKTSRIFNYCYTRINEC